MALGRQARNQRSSPRVDVLMRVKGELVPIGSPIRVLNLNRTGFAVLSDVRFRHGQRVVVRLAGIGGPEVEVAATALHAEPRASAPGVYLTGFQFQFDRSRTGTPETGVLDLLAKVAPAGFKV